MFLRLTLNITATQELPDAEALDLFRGRVDYTVDNKLGTGKVKRKSRAERKALMTTTGAALAAETTTTTTTTTTGNLTNFDYFYFD